MENDKVIVDFNKYHKQMNELDFLKDVAVGLMDNTYTIQEFREKMCNENKKYGWWY